MSLEKRVEKFDTLCERFECLRPDKLAVAYKIPEAKFEKFKLATKQYLSSVFPNPIPILEETEFLQTFKEQRELITNITPGGVILPKSNLTLDYNCWLRAISDIFQDLRIEDLVSAIRMPVPRYKSGKVSGGTHSVWALKRGNCIIYLLSIFYIPQSMFLFFLSFLCNLFQ